jgi:hypothetical protein
MWCDRDYVASHIEEIGVLWVRFVLLAQPMGYIRYPECTANLQLVGMVIIEILINLSPVLWRFRRQNQLVPGRSQ